MDSEIDDDIEEFSWVGPGKEEAAPQLSNRKTKTSQRTIQMVMKYDKIDINNIIYTIGDVIAYGRLTSQNIGKIKAMWVDEHQVRKDIIEITKYTKKKIRRKKGVSDPSLKELTIMDDTLIISPYDVLNKCVLYTKENFDKLSLDEQLANNIYYYNDKEPDQLTIKRKRKAKKLLNSIKTINLSDSEKENEGSEYENLSDITDEDEINKKKRTRKKRITKKAKIVKNSKNLIIPKAIPSRNIPLSETLSDYEKARKLLHVSAVPDSLPCREKEFAEIYSYLECAISQESGCCLYISGVPGTGKTATVREVIRCLNRQVEEQKLNDFQFVEINGMKITDPIHSYILLWKALSNSNDKITSKHAAELLESTFSNASSNRLPCVVLMDELDLLVTKKQSVMYNFFDWPNRPYSHLIVVAVANTMDLPERMLTNKVSSRLGLTRINFQPYTHEQLITIVQSRLQGISSFSDDAIQLCARRVSAVSGDARRALDICRQAVEIVERKSKQSKGEKLLVTPAIISQVTKSIFASPTMMIIKRACLHQKIFLISVVNELRRSGIGETSFGCVSNEHLSLCRIYNIERPTISNLSAICSTLGGIKCLIVEGGRADLYGRVRLNVNEEDIIMALKNDPIVGKMIR
ncbi:P-loop containing nucleoside triphosphate hydrolase protein [Anaeromyces robustus]|uniref:Origin recognition complex subunit 1 n=1 Tax=Anaeromyces robustus TaxID=1754192 RepID=A0A1Y1XQ80_9FUNG|nr:P-loop containing nucleoside triphosphate hydrolase protein [Anaeromyces robustus]|eukprot:ORX87891.1 P-loop containing nucleoside triphosphate hydrolase protein [Anaeromyces robustus]